MDASADEEPPSGPPAGAKGKRSRAREDPTLAADGGDEPLGPRPNRGKRRRATDYEEGYEVPTRQSYARESKSKGHRAWEAYDIKPDPER